MSSSFQKLRNLFKNKRGFTLVELLLGIVLISLVLAIVFQFFGFTNRMMQKTDKLAMQQDQARLIVQGLRKDIGTALRVAIVDTDYPESSSSASYPDSVVDTGALFDYALYAKGGLLIRRDAAATGDSDDSFAYTGSAAQGLTVEFSCTEPKVVHVVISAGDALVSETDIFTPNTDVNLDAADTTTFSGDVIMYKGS